MANVYAKLDIGISSSNYLGQGSEGRKDSFSALDLQLDTKTDSDILDTRSLVQSEIGLTDSNYRFIEIPDMYVATSPKLFDNARTTFGRRLTDWSVLDQTWGAGAFQPRFRWDYLRPQQVGLLGLYQELKSGPVKLTAFYSPIFIPDRGAPLDFADGRIRSISPWVVNPPYEIEIMRKSVPVRYDAQVPSIGSIIRQDTIGGQMMLDAGEGVWGSVSYMHKPMNQLLMSYEAYLAADDAHVTLYPRVAYHHVASMDLGMHGKTMSGSISGIADIPTDDFHGPTLWTSQQVGNMFLVSPSLTMYPWGSKKGGNLSVSYLRVIGKDPPDTGYLADGTSREFDSRYPFKSAFLMTAELPQWRRLTTDFRLLFDIQNPGTIVSWMFTYAPDRDWKLFLATDVLSSFTDETADGTDFIHRYRENDRVTGGVTYVF
ncbi:MAG: hypothetical protein JST04_18365 [Bdellovibrionales bacterium]|nr:hypothetical protein [Bdellovibrionales bacterium]